MNRINRTVAAILLIMLLIFASGCQLFDGDNKKIELSTSEEALTSSEPSTLKEIISSAETSSSKKSFANLEGILLPFDENGKLVWDASDFKDAYLDYEKERKEFEALYAHFSKKDATEFIYLLNEINKKLVGTEKGNLNNESWSFDKFKLEDRDYRFSTFKDVSISFYKAEECGYLRFWIDGEDAQFDFHHSLYKISTDSFQKFEHFFDRLDKSWELLYAKPIIYLYPESKTDVSVKLNYDGKLAVTYPAYNNGWNVSAYPDGHLINKADGLEYSYLFWEGLADKQDWNLSEGYCVAGKDTAVFLQQTLSRLGLTPREYNEFIVYWLPLMQDNPYNLITFQWEEYEKAAPLDITPAPDSILRVFMVFKPLDKPIEVKAPAERPAFERNGFTVVEWGGTKTGR